MSILYHYCSNQTFLSIIENVSIRLSSLSLSNDSMEGKLVTDIVYHLAQDDGLQLKDIERLQAYINGVEQIIIGLGLCLSVEGDLLSQWRGYANDGAGVSIGFSRKYLEELSEASNAIGQRQPGFTLEKVAYEMEKQIEMIKPIYEEIKLKLGNNQMWLGNNPITASNLVGDIRAKLSFIGKQFLLKIYAFHEEKEWRLVSLSSRKPHHEKCSFFAKNDKIVPYREYELKELRTEPISEIILGPKNVTPIGLVEKCLEQNSFKDFEVKRSEATYR